MTEEEATIFLAAHLSRPKEEEVERECLCGAVYWFSQPVGGVSRDPGCCDWCMQEQGEIDELQWGDL